MSMPCDTGLCNPDKCTDEFCPSKASIAAGAVLPDDELTTIAPLTFSLVDRCERGSNNFISRYIEHRKLRVPGKLK